MSPRNDVRLSLSVSLSHAHTHKDTHTHSHTDPQQRECVSTTLRDYVNEMKYSDGLVSETWVIVEQKQNMKERKRKRREREGWGGGSGRGVVSSFSTSAGMTHDSFYAGFRSEHSSRCDSTSSLMSGFFFLFTSDSSLLSHLHLP